MVRSHSPTDAADAAESMGPRYVCRLVTPAGAMFPVQEYLRVDDPPEWTRRRVEADTFPFLKASRIVRRLTSPECLVYDAIPQSRTEPVMPAQPRHDWHEGKPNCGVE